ncbi:nucleotide sugar dehydrogenase [Halobacteria archaeon AArc-m2/3/4]|uniref:UDP-N-acetyl-D-mannosamine dehydrogenase n=1 Tax=Natronoglomus mannanivorans TaxID=2979990 RepID=A0ABT2QGT2_9EURY|nr:nucleotide sugar dehydrogenase [Halobacteria archaeon AArc-m2/3/4]
MNPTISDIDSTTEEEREDIDGDGDGVASATGTGTRTGVVHRSSASSRRRDVVEHPAPTDDRAREATVCVVGLGYVGLPLAVGFSRENYQVLGYDIDESKVESLRNGVDTTGDVGDDAIQTEEIAYTTDADVIGEADYVVITVPTPIDDTDRPRLDFVESAGRTVGANMAPGTTVVLESTVYPGATREVLVPALEESSELEAGKDFFVAYSPERATPADDEHTLENVVKVVGAADNAVREHVAALYETVVDAGVYRAPSIEVAEACKVVENAQRDLNIALVNELAMAFDRMDIDTQAVLEAASTKWNFHDYRPGLVGGHCIPVDPYFLTHRASQEGYDPQLLLASRDVNEAMPEHVAKQTFKALNQCDKTLRQSDVLVLGLAYKPDVADIRSSKAAAVVEELREFDVNVVGYDPLADDDAVRSVFDIDVQEELSFEGIDAVVFATAHSAFDDLEPDEMAAELADEPALIDVAGAFDRDAVTDAGIAYWGV